MTRKTNEIASGDTGRIKQYNDLRREAAASSYLMPYAQDTPDLTLKVSEGRVWFGGTLIEYVGGNSPSFAAPSANPRIDVLSINSAGNLVRTAGSEAASPTMPSIPAGNIPICSVYNRVGQTSVKDADDSTNGYIYKDLRPIIYKIETEIVASDILRHSNDSVKSTTSASLVKLKEIVISELGIMGLNKNDIIKSLRVSFFGNGEATRTYQARIYKNGVAMGTLQTIPSGGGGATFSEDLGTFVKDDLIQLYAKGQDGFRCDVSNFRLYYSQYIVPEQTFINQDPS